MSKPPITHLLPHLPIHPARLRFLPIGRTIAVVQIPCLLPQEAHVSAKALGEVAVPSSPKTQYDCVIMFK
ncbi:hypothetical protein NC653_031920 [Populus alba x Populus x berolinensis]|uniref:Uncharacterized protein n=1 Tax=Populus alba x Populus x berolinensis TaxID=444605 RepID=A0AAD6LZL4_9ROSI|nr:hypothetical protein NC653_031920 [Populus alba x Populus x berolinensis]